MDDPDCPICEESSEIAFLVAGGVCNAARAIARGEIARAFCAVRPPGHHAERERAMGFCLLNNVALAAETLRAEFAMERILILDWDVHHGNGTQHVFESDSGVLFISLHGHPDTLYPGTGYADEVGIGAGRGFTLNLPFMPGAGDAEFRDAFLERVLPAADAFSPQFVIVSAGFDAHADDPLGNLRLQDDTYMFMCGEVLELARRCAGGRVLSVLEGGYNLAVLRRCVAQHVQMLAAE
jgi:acetoin utilization deacetylase AcuC-like enzyme